ncbi:MAG: cbb3-type cytochrome c oxidase subunit I [Rhodospirillaceae bacterium]|nr:cbb3-type cytochrome c oxidase subunit I [Rhodospirillaceae bacterium]
MTLEQLTGPVGPQLKSELRGWAGLAIISMAIAGVFALLLALSRTPGVETLVSWPEGFFQKGLVIHVVFSFVVWFLAVFGGLLAIATNRLTDGRPHLGWLGKIAIVAGYISTVPLFVPALMNRGQATLNNYVPAITDPVYYAGLALLGAAIGMMVLRLLIRIPGSDKRWKEPLPFGVITAGFGFSIALICFAVAANSLAGEELSFEFNESLFWGGGHVLQFVNTALLLVALYSLGHITLKGDFGDRELTLTAFAFLGLYPIFGLIVTLKYAPVAMKYWDMLTTLQYGMAFPALLFGVPALLSVLKHRREGTTPWRDPAYKCLVLAPLVFAVGGILGLFVDGGDTRTPAHYHAIIAGINLSFMGLFYGLFLPLLGRSLDRSKAITAQIYMFAGGQLFAAIGLFWAGGYGTPRKASGAAQGLQDMGAVIGMYMNGIGALIAVIGGVMFIWMAGRALLKSSPQ